MSLKDYKKMAKSQGIDDVSKELDTLSNKRERDPRFWEPTRDENKRSFSIVRFLPAPLPEKPPAVRQISYWFDGPGGKYVELSPATINLPDPVKEYSKKLWNSGDEEEAKKFFPRTTYISNILVLKDSACPENEGKVWLFRYGKKIFSKIQERIKPQFQHETRVNVFDFWAGASFKLKTCDVGGYVNYDQSEFESPSELYDGDEELIEQVYETLHPLQPFVDASNFKPYEELKAEFHKVMGFEGEGKAAKAAGKKASKPEEEEEDTPPPKKPKAKPTTLEEDDVPDFDTKPKGKPKPKVEEDEDETLDDDEDEDETLSEDEEVETPPKKPKPAAAPAKKPTKPAPKAEEEEAEEEEEAPKKPAKPTAKAATKKPKDEEIEEDVTSFFDDVEE